MDRRWLSTSALVSRYSLLLSLFCQNLWNICPKTSWSNAGFGQWGVTPTRSPKRGSGAIKAPGPSFPRQPEDTRSARSLKVKPEEKPWKPGWCSASVDRDGGSVRYRLLLLHMGNGRKFLLACLWHWRWRSPSKRLITVLNTFTTVSFLSEINILLCRSNRVFHHESSLKGLYYPNFSCLRLHKAKLKLAPWNFKPWVGHRYLEVGASWKVKSRTAQFFSFDWSERRFWREGEALILLQPPAASRHIRCFCPSSQDSANLSALIMSRPSITV